MAPSEGPDWSRIWSEAGRHREADRPRRQAIREAFDATKPAAGRPALEVRDRLVAELVARGVDEVSPSTLDLLVESLQTSPTRTLFHAGARLFGQVRELAASMNEGAQPRWMNPPSSAARFSWDDFDDHQEVVMLEVQIAHEAAPLVDRLFATAPDVSVEGRDRQVFDCWLSLEHSEDVFVHVGKHVLGQLRADDAKIVAGLIRSTKHRQMTFSGFLTGTNASDAHIRVSAPEPT